MPSRPPIRDPDHKPVPRAGRPERPPGRNVSSYYVDRRTVRSYRWAMSSARAASVGLIALGALAAGPRGASAQGAMFEVVYGAWFADDDTSARVLHAGLTNRLLGPLGWGVGFAHVQDTRDSLSRSFSGAEFSLSLWRHGSGPYVLASTGFGVRHRGGTDMFWSAGAGYQVRLLRLFTL